MSDDDNKNNFLAAARLFPTLFRDDIRSYTPPFSTEPPTTDDLQEALRRTYVAPPQPDHRPTILQMLQQTDGDQKADNDAFSQNVGTQVFPSNATPPPQSNSSLIPSPPTLASAINLPDEESQDDIGTVTKAGADLYSLQLQKGHAYLDSLRAKHPNLPQYNDNQFAQIGESVQKLEELKQVAKNPSYVERIESGANEVMKKGLKIAYKTEWMKQGLIDANKAAWLGVHLKGLELVLKKTGGMAALPADDEHVTADQLYFQSAIGVGPKERTFTATSQMGGQLSQGPEFKTATEQAKQQALKGDYSKVEIIRDLGKPRKKGICLIQLILLLMLQVEIRLEPIRAVLEEMFGLYCL